MTDKDKLLIISANIKRDFNKSLSENKTFGEMIRKIMADKNWDSADFECETDLSKKIYSDIKKSDYKPTMRIVISICIGLKLDILKTQELLNCAGLCFAPTDKVHYAYLKLITRFEYLNIEDCNKVLKKLGIEKKYLLGSLSRE